MDRSPAALLAKLSAVANVPQAWVDHGGLRRSALRALCDFAVPEGRPAAALLWLTDNENKRLALSHYAFTGTETPRPPELVFKHVPLPGFKGGEPPQSWLPGIEENSDVKLWCRERGLMLSDRWAIPLRTRNPEGRWVEGDLTGVVQMLGASGIDQGCWSMREAIGDMMCALVLRSRGTRRRRAHEELMAFMAERPPEGGGWLDEDRILVGAARILVQATDAALCIVHRLDHQKGLPAVAAFPDDFEWRQHFATFGSPTHAGLGFREVARIPNIKDESHVRRVFHGCEVDATVAGQIGAYLRRTGNSVDRARMSLSVRCRGESLGILIKLVNKNRCLSEEFSETDARILAEVGDDLGRLLRAGNVERAVERLSLVQPRQHHWHQEDRETDPTYDALADSISGLFCGAMASVCGLDEPPKLVRLGGEIACLEDLSSAQIDQAMVEPLARPTAPPVWARAFAIDLQADVRRYLVLTRRDRTFTDWERWLIGIACMELRQVLRGEAQVEEAKHHLLQVRHAIRSGLTPVIPGLQTLRMQVERVAEGKLPPAELQGDSFRRRLLRATSYAVRVHALLEGARILLHEIDPGSFQFLPRSVSREVKDVCSALRDFASGREIEIDFQNEIPATLDTARLDRTLMFVAMFNVLDNAVKYGHRGTRVQVRGFADTRTWRLRVSNTGVYLEPADFTKIFRPLVRLQPGRSDAVRSGTGLGLPVAKAIVEAHGGRIEVESRRSGPTAAAGFTTFQLVMPRDI